MVKSAEEIELIKHGARIGDLGGEAIRAAITEGVPEFEVALAGTNAMVREISERIGPPIATLLDLQGPQIRTGTLKDHAPDTQKPVS